MTLSDSEHAARLGRLLEFFGYGHDRTARAGLVYRRYPDVRDAATQPAGSRNSMAPSGSR